MSPRWKCCRSDVRRDALLTSTAKPLVLTAEKLQTFVELHNAENKVMTTRNYALWCHKISLWNPSDGLFLSSLTCGVKNKSWSRRLKPVGLSTSLGCLLRLRKYCNINNNLSLAEKWDHCRMLVEDEVKDVWMNGVWMDGSMRHFWSSIIKFVRTSNVCLLVGWNTLQVRIFDTVSLCALYHCKILVANNFSTFIIATKTGGGGRLRGWFEEMKAQLIYGAFIN